MRKLTAYTLTAAAALAAAGTITITSHAAVNTYPLPGGSGKVVMITGNNRNEINDILNRIPGGMYSQDCAPMFPWQPDFNLPGSNQPDNSLPAPEYPIPDQPDNSLPTPENPVPDQPDGGESHDAAVNEVLRLVNEERSRAGVASLTLHEGASAAAGVRAKEIETVFSHTRPGGSSFSSALTEAGVSYRAAGENIAYGQKSAGKVMQDWMNSSGHRANILNGTYTSIGIGHYRSASGVDYWTQLFIN